MKINVSINDKLMAKAQRLSNITDKNVLVEKALQLFITVENQEKLIGLWGKVKIDDEAYK